ncbi:MAG TPA: DUF4846 domain-containing protein [Phycisphaerae bacterium]|nr:DUF4846 domain-containing protein [Phycisphaerae bacterium]
MVEDRDSTDAPNESADFELEEETSPPAEAPPPSIARVLGVVLFLAVVLFAARQISRTGTGAPDTQPAESSSAQSVPVADRPAQYPWLSLKDRKKYEPLAARIPPPDGFARVDVAAGSFADWLRFLPMLPEGSPVVGPKGEVIMPANDRSLAGAVALQPHTAKTLSAPNILVRLRAEYLWATGRMDDLAFHFTSGHLSTWKEWASGLRPTVRGKNVTVAKSASADTSRTNFTGYLESIFQYGTVYSLFKDTDKASEPVIEAGSVFIRVGRPGHAVMILDVARNPEGQTRVLIGEGGTPVRTFHVLRAGDGSPWFPLGRSEPIDLGAKGVFHLKDLRHWPA